VSYIKVTVLTCYKISSMCPTNMSSFSDSDADSLDDTEGIGIEHKLCISKVEASFKSVLVHLASERRYPKRDIHHTKVHSRKQKNDKEAVSSQPHDSQLKRELAYELEDTNGVAETTQKEEQSLERRFDQTKENEKDHPKDEAIQADRYNTLVDSYRPKKTSQESENKYTNEGRVESAQSQNMIYKVSVDVNFNNSEHGAEKQSIRSILVDDKSERGELTASIPVNASEPFSFRSDDDSCLTICTSDCAHDSSESVNVTDDRKRNEQSLVPSSSSSSRETKYTKSHTSKGSSNGSIVESSKQLNLMELDDDSKSEEKLLDGINKSRRRLWARLICILLAATMIIALVLTVINRNTDPCSLQGSDDGQVAANEVSPRIHDANLSDSLSLTATDIRPALTSSAPTTTDPPSPSNTFSLAPPSAPPSTMGLFPVSNSPRKDSDDLISTHDYGNSTLAVAIASSDAATSPNMTKDDLEFIKVDNILARVQQPLESAHGCTQTGVMNLFDNVISDFSCHVPAGGPTAHAIPTIPTFIFNTGSSLVTGIRVFAATECYGCDPMSFLVEGYYDADFSWKLIASGLFNDAWSKAGTRDVLPPRRNPKFASTIGSSSHGRLTYGFVDFTAFEHFVPVIYSRYKLQFPGLRYGSETDQLKLGKLQLIGALVP